MHVYKPVVLLRQNVRESYISNHYTQSIEKKYDRGASFFGMKVLEVLFTQPLRSGRIWHKVNF